jgi:hypothetical protein
MLPIKIKNIRANNGVYTAKLFQESCARSQQHLTFCAVGAHWQNRIAERFIGSITQQECTILFYFSQQLYLSKQAEISL